MDQVTKLLNLRKTNQVFLEVLRNFVDAFPDIPNDVLLSMCAASCLGCLAAERNCNTPETKEAISLTKLASDILDQYIKATNEQ